MVIDALFAECVETVEAFGALVALEADLAGEELIVDLLGELATSGGRRHPAGDAAGDAVDRVLVNGRRVVPLTILTPSKPSVCVFPVFLFLCFSAHVDHLIHVVVL